MTTGSRRRRVRTLAALGLVAVLAAGGCSRGGSEDSGTARSDAAAPQPALPQAPEAGRAPAEGEAPPPERGATDLRVEQRSIVYSGTMRVRVDGDVEAAARDAAAAATGAGGFVGADERHSTGSNARAELQLRVPAEKFTSILDQLAGLGRQESRRISTEDVTEAVVDLDARIATQRARVESARRLLARAESISDLVTLESELARREADLASLEAKKRRLADLTALSTITVTLVGADASTAEEESETGFLAGLRAGWRVFGISVTVLLTVLGALLPWLIVLGVPVGALVVWLRRRKRSTPPPPGGPSTRFGLAPPTQTPTPPPTPTPTGAPTPPPAPPTQPSGYDPK
ncbi:DUF4349 domain-containing protein [Micromonospora sp. WMMA1923]|uniref:DUF4349 domain-containing protein n=1 Tax=Micromonospora sp. WMMA1923 TaxID=3404125 RepID=UPI003B93A82F